MRRKKRSGDTCASSPSARRGSPASRWRVAHDTAIGVVLLILVASAIGCAPILATFVQPQAPGGKLKNGLSGQYPEYITFKRDGVVAALHAKPAGSGGRAVEISFEVPAHQTVRLLGDSLEVTTSRGGPEQHALTGTWYGSGGRSLPVPPDSVMHGSTERLRYGTRTGYGLTKHELFVFSAKFTAAAGDTFTVDLPAVEVSGQPWSLPPVRFVRVRRWVFISLPA